MTYEGCKIYLMHAFTYTHKSSFTKKFLCFGLLAVDLQRCGISNEGVKVLEKMLQSNSTVCVLDIRRNPLVGQSEGIYTCEESFLA